MSKPRGRWSNNDCLPSKANTETSNPVRRGKISDVLFKRLADERANIAERNNLMNEEEEKLNRIHALVGNESNPNSQI